MIPSQPQLHGYHHPFFDYHFKHAFAWPPPNGALGGEAANLAAAGVGAGEAAGAAAGANLARQMHWHHYHGRGGWGRPRFGFGRRFIWFGLGALAASWYYKHQEHKRRHERAVAYPTTGPNTYSNNPPEPSYASGHWKHEWSWPASGQSPTPPQYKPFTPPTPHTPPTQAAVPQTEAQIKSAILAELQNSTHDAEPEAQPAEERSRRWGWGGRHRRHREEQFTPAVAEVNVNATGRNTETSQEEMRKLRAAVETIWEEKKSSAVRTQETVNEQARAYAKQKVEKLSAALEALRDSLETETDKKIRKAGEKLV